LKKNLQNIEENLEEINKLQSLLKDFIEKKRLDDSSQIVLSDLLTAIERYREAYLEFKLITQASIDVIVRLSASGKISYISPSCRELAGYEPYEVTGKPFTEFIPQSKVFEYTNLILNLFRKREQITFGMDVVHKDGHLVPVEINGKIIQLGGKSYAQVALRDIGQRIADQKKLESSENTFRTVWDKSSDGMLLTDEEGCIFMCRFF
jgi:PAS domain S-box-containing protein